MLEIEAKFLARRPADVEALLQAIAATGARIDKLGTATHTDTYFDTADWSVLRAGWAFRRRDRGGARMLVLKSRDAASDAVFRREEIEQPLPDGVDPGGGTLPPGPVQERLAAIAGRRRRRELFSVRTERAAWAVRLPDGPEFELHLDTATVAGRKRSRTAPGSLSFIELELELKHGGVGALRGLARRLAGVTGVIPARTGKFDRGLRAIGAAPTGGGDTAPARRWRGRDPFVDLVFDYLGERVAALEEHFDAAWEGIDPEGVHKMRVSVRRARAMLAAFPDLFGGTRFTVLDRELCWLGRQLGEARDADVSALNAASCIAALPTDAAAAAEPFVRFLRARADDASARLVRALGSRRYRKLAATLHGLVDAGPDRSTRRRLGAITVTDATRRHVLPLLQRLMQRGGRVGPETPAAEIHKLRIRAKQLRYVLDLMSAAKPRRWLSAIRALEKLQDLLGAHQDACTARARLDEFLSCPAGTRADRATLLAIGRLMQFEEDRMARCRARFPRAWLRLRRSVT